MALDRSGIDAIQAYYIEHLDTIYEKTFSEPVLGNFMNVTTKDKLILPNGQASESLQSYQVGHQTKGNVTLSGRTLEMKMVKVDNTIETRAFDTEFYYAFMNASGNDPKQWPFQRWVIDMFLRQMYEDFNLEALWGGTYVAPTPGTPNAAAEVMDGFVKLINDQITATTITPVATGAIGATTAVAQIRAFVKSNLPTNGKRKRLHFVYCSQDTVDKYQEDYETKFGTAVKSDNPYKLTRIHGSNSFLIPQDGLAGDELIHTRPENMWLGFDGAPHIELEYSSRQVKIEVDWKIGAQFAAPFEIYVNDQL